MAGHYDVVVLGTGAAGLTAALSAHESGARVGLFEKSDEVGGTSAWSGGMLWIPCNPHQDALGVQDSREEARTYLDGLSHGTIEPELVDAFLAAGPEMIAWLEQHTPARFAIVEGFPDYHCEHPGGKPGGGRSLECPLFAFDRLGDWADRVTRGRQLAAGAGAVNITVSETPLGRGAPDGVDPDELARRRVHDERGAGQALVGSLLLGCLERGIEPRTGHRAVTLETDDGAVTGVHLEADGQRRLVGASSVVLATGGFEWDPDLVRSFLRGPMTRPVSIPTNTGDGLRMAMRLGAGLGNMREAWWLATVDVPDGQGGTIPWMINGERVRPHTIMVNRHGVRFANEASNYNAFGAAFHQLDPGTHDYRNLPAWMIFDRTYLEQYGFATHRRGDPTPDWMVEAPDVRTLAARVDVDPDRLEATVAAWNAACEKGIDPDFGRGESAHDRWWGDPALTGEGPRATLGPLDAPPLYAVQVHPGALGTKGGPRTTVDAQVVDVDGAPIPGLYAAGNAMAGVTGMTYGGAGGTLGPGMTFAYLAGRHAGRTRRAEATTGS